jgi:hypothetical protein
VKLESYNNIDKFGVKMKQDIVLWKWNWLILLLSWH